MGAFIKDINDQAVMSLKSAQMPAMHSSSHWNFPQGRNTLQSFSQTCIRPEILIERKILSGAHKGTAYQVVPEVLRPLRTLVEAIPGSSLYPQYSEDELAILTPTFLQ